MEFSKGYRGWLLFVLLLANAMNLADRQTMAVLGQAIKAELQFSDTQLGIIQGIGFAIFYTAMGLPLARLAERYSRARIISASVALFGAMAALCGTATSFTRMLLFRVGVGIGDAGLGSPVASLIGDHFPRDRRASAMSILWLGAPVGVLTGATAAGWIADHLGWRMAFYAVGIPAIAVALLAVATLREPPRGTFDVGTASAPPPWWTVFKFLFAKPGMRHTLIGCGLAAVSMNAIGQFIVPFLVRAFDMSLTNAGRTVGLIASISMASGLLVGGFGVDRASKRDRRWFGWGPAIGLALAGPTFLAGFYQRDIAAAIALLMFAHVTMFVYYAPSLAIAQNMVGANMRATAGFVVSAVLGLVGIGFGPTLNGLLSDHFASGAFTLGNFTSMCPKGFAPNGSAPELVAACKAASATGLKHAMYVMSTLCLWAAFHYVLAARTIRRDFDTFYEAEAGAAQVPR